MGPAFFIYKIFILLNHLKFYSGKFYGRKISNLNAFAANTSRLYITCTRIGDSKSHNSVRPITQNS